MSRKKHLKNLLIFLSDLYDKEDRLAGDQAAAALRKAANNIPDSLPAAICPKLNMAEEALAINPIAKSEIVKKALPYLTWIDPKKALENILVDKAAGMMACELLGPTGMIKCNGLRVGLYVQDPNLNYTTRVHCAEETYVTLGGIGYWGINGKEPTHRPNGEIIYHPSMIPHQNITKADPMIAAWRWSGDISYDKYYPE